jgi:curved DNA-binding protein CbpA
VSTTCDLATLRAAYRAKAREFHPDVADGAETAMIAVNDAWRVLSDPLRRAEYDESLATIEPPLPPVPQPPPATTGSRRQAWVAGVQAQVVRLSRLAGRSSVQTLLLRGPRAERAVYDAIVEEIVRGLARETEARVRAARAAGAAPLDLGVASTLVGIRALADSIRRQSSLGVSPELIMTAELLDRMWDVLAHELPITLTNALGGNPAVAKKIGSR